MPDTAGERRSGGQGNTAADKRKKKSLSCDSAQVIRAVLKDPKDYTELRLLYANTSPADVLLKKELEAFAAEHDNFSVWFTGMPPLTVVVFHSCSQEVSLQVDAASH